MGQTAGRMEQREVEREEEGEKLGLGVRGLEEKGGAREIKREK